MQARNLLTTAMRHHQTGQLGNAEQGYRAVLAIEPRNVDALHLLGVVAHQRGHNDAALDLIGRAIGQNGRVAAFHHNLGNVLGQLGRQADAVAAYRQAIRLQPEHVEAHASLAGLLVQQGEAQEALAAIDRALALRPLDAGKHVNRGNILHALGRSDAAIAAYRRAIELEPALAAAHNNLGLALIAREEVEAALPCYRRAITLKPDYVEAYVHLGNALQDLGQSGDAAAAYRQALVLQPDRADARLALAMTAIPIMPATPEAAAGTPHAFAAALDALATHPQGLSAAAGRSQPFYLAYRPVDVTADLCRYGDLVATPQPVPDREARTGRLRLLIVSAHVRDHPVWRVNLQGLLTHLDRSRFDVAVFHTGARTDEHTAWAAANVDTFVGGERNVAAWRAKIVEYRPDIILYPEVGMDPVTGALASQRLAAVQAAGWGHPITTGLPTIDLFFSGEALEGPDADRHYRERLVRLPRTGVSIEWTAEGGEPWQGPERAADVVRFALCQQPIKFDPADDALLTRIAKGSGACEFWLVMPNRQQWAGKQLVARLRDRFAEAGLDPDRYIKVASWMTSRRFNGFLDAMDVYLDCPAFSGFTTALQAVQRGLPIVTLEGRFLRQRMAAGLLRDIGMLDGITETPDAYVERAVAWANHARDTAGWSRSRDLLRDAASRAMGDPEPMLRLQDALIAAAG
ncbi:glycosyltransferase family 41 protein [Sphingomonas populi]|uniref:protein O-GlcNAc transferase n=1 Tax=Sphingomonas populi TaxID=2484750 RepID=A0A4Q6XZC0_9SPHN|nr:glycosyltransferase family 41 protein [Sphingomonas populi]RZF66243.1 glycosyltransferase family 41 protein [Sphingomonas populi]